MAGPTIKHLGPLPKYWTIGRPEHANVVKSLKRPLSGYIGGQPSDGYFIKLLSDCWRDEFQCHYAVPCNSATSGLMAACMAADIGPGDEVWCSAYTMSATATCAMMLGATVKFMDIDPVYFCITGLVTVPLPKVLIVTNLFGCAAHLPAIRAFCDVYNVVMIEDNAQAPYATVGGQFTGTIGHMGVFSLNVHKHFQCGEGGVVVTNSATLAERLERAINHGELAPGWQQIGGNFRMTEPIAAIACAQLKKGYNLVQTRVTLAEAITAIFKQVSFVEPPAKRFGEIHAYYMWAGQILGPNAKDLRAAFVGRLRDRGVPFKIGYTTPLHRLFKADYGLPVVDEIERARLFTFEICAYDLKRHHLRRMRDIILWEAESIEGELESEKEQEVCGERGGASLGSVSEPL